MMDNYALPRKLPFSKKNLPARVIISYIVDYVIIILLFIAFWALDAIEPFHQHFSLNNFTLQYPFATKERVSVGLLFFLVVLVPAAIIAFYTLLLDGRFSHQKGTFRFKDRLWELNCGILGLLLASGTAFVITGALKNATGKPRPDIIDRCQPVAGSVDSPIFGLSNSTICTQTDHAILKDGFRSFPSGHSSSSFGGLFYLSLYLAGKLHVLDNRGEVWKNYVVLAPTLGAALIAVSRIMDARHHPFDVITGSLLGILTAFVAYRQYFPPISEPWRKGRAYPIRSWGTIPGAPSTSHEEREMARDQGVEPMRNPPIRSNDEGPRVMYSAPPVHNEAGPSEQNVFRQQISNSQRVRQQEFEPARGDPSQYTTAYDPQARANPYSAPIAPRGRERNNDDYWESSSSEHEVAVEDGYELQPKYTLTDSRPEGSVQPPEGTRYAVENFGHTAYNPQAYAGGIPAANPQHMPGPSTVPPAAHPALLQHGEHNVI